MDYNHILRMEPMELIDWLTNEFSVDMPQEIITVEDMENASKLLLKLSGSYAYLSVLLAHAKIATRALKKIDKTKYEVMMDRRDAISSMAEAVKQEYAGVSRGVAIKIENNRELQMNSNGFIKQ